MAVAGELHFTFDDTDGEERINENAGRGVKSSQYSFLTTASA
jgi:hypothetical protein